jgi:hypothetical protein
MLEAVKAILTGAVDGGQGVRTEFSCMFSTHRIWRSAMPIRILKKAGWNDYFGLVSRVTLVGKCAEIEVGSISFGMQIEAEWMPLLGVVYDEKDDVLEIILDGLDHLIHRPLEIYVDDGASVVSSFAVVDHAGCRHIVRLREPLMLPAPARVS